MLCSVVEILSLAIIFILRGKPGHFIAWFAIKCSSLCGMNRGTSMRSACNSMGDESKPSVAQSNCMIERTPGLFLLPSFHVLLRPPQKNMRPRTICLMMLTSACSGVWAVEQPGSSVLECYPAFLHLLNSHYQLYGISSAGHPGHLTSHAFQLLGCSSGVVDGCLWRA